MGLTELAEDGIYTVVSKYLGLSGTLAWNLLHQGAILTSGALMGEAKLGMRDLTHIVTPPMTKFMSALDTTARVLADPNIEGIVIGTPKMQFSRQADVSESATIVQSQGRKEYRIDNITPRLRNWQFTGYLRSSSGILDFGQTIKPTLWLQYTYLDACMVSRKPVWFKDNNNMFHRVLITQLACEQDPTATNVIKISLALKEYKPLTMDTSFIHGVVAAAMGAPEGVI